MSNSAGDARDDKNITAIIEHGEVADLPLRILMMWSVTGEDSVMSIDQGEAATIIITVVITIIIITNN